MIGNCCGSNNLVEPEKVEETAEGEERQLKVSKDVEGTTAATTEEGKPSDDKAKAAPGDKGGSCKTF